MTKEQGLERRKIRETILELVNDRGVGKTICPSEVAKKMGLTDWRKLLKQVRSEAVALAKASEISIYRKGRAVDPDDFKGVYRLGLPGKPLPGGGSGS